jgi:tetratricopeptide (TPR) repeat protein
LNPNDSIAHFSYADDVLLPQKRFAEALEHCRAGRQIDPLSTIGAMCIPWVTIYSGDSKAAVAEFDEILATDPDNFMARGARGFAYMRGENYLKAIEDFEAVRPYSPMPAIPFLAYSYGRSGQTAKAAALEQLVMARARTNYVSPMVLAIVHLGVGKKSLTLDELEQGVEQHSYNAMFLGTESALDSLRGESRFKALLLKMHLK